MTVSRASLAENVEAQQQMSADVVGIFFLKGKEEGGKLPTGCFQLQQRRRTEGGARGEAGGGEGQLERWARFGEGVG